MATLWDATHTCAIPIVFVNERCLSHRKSHRSWSSKLAGLPEISEEHFVSSAGDEIDIVQFGTWNREAGPDFRDAAIRINGGDPIRGCIEIDLLDRSWETHGHATNPAFDETVLHVFVERGDREFFTRTKSNRNVPQVLLILQFYQTHSVRIFR